MRELSPLVSNWRASDSLDALLADHGVAGITGIDTRAVTRRIRVSGAQRAVITRAVDDAAGAVARARSHPSLEGRDLVQEVTAASGYEWDEPVWAGPAPLVGQHPPTPPVKFHVVAYDYGMKRGILRRLRQSGCRVTVVPAATPAKEVLALKPDGIFLSNGPGDPAAVGYAIEAARELCASKLPVFGICLGHQILGLALGGKTYKLKFGHHGANHPVMDLQHPQGGDHLAEPRLRRRRRFDAGAGRADARQPERQDGRGDAAQHAARVQRPVPPRGVPRAERRELPVRSVRHPDERASPVVSDDDSSAHRSPRRALRRG